MNNSVYLLLAGDSATSDGLAVAGYSAIKQASRPLEVCIFRRVLTRKIASLRTFWSGASEVHTS
jgi:hypothetical protein